MAPILSGCRPGSSRCFRSSPARAKSVPMALGGFVDAKVEVSNAGLSERVAPIGPRKSASRLERCPSDQMCDARLSLPICTSDLGLPPAARNECNAIAIGKIHVSRSIRRHGNSSRRCRRRAARISRDDILLCVHRGQSRGAPQPPANRNPNSMHAASAAPGHKKALVRHFTTHLALFHGSAM
jgi:hypothetical protein